VLISGNGVVRKEEEDKEMRLMHLLKIIASVLRQDFLIFSTFLAMKIRKEYFA